MQIRKLVCVWRSGIVPTKENKRGWWGCEGWGKTGYGRGAEGKIESGSITYFSLT